MGMLKYSKNSRNNNSNSNNNNNNNNFIDDNEDSFRKEAAKTWTNCSLNTSANNIIENPSELFININIY